MSEKQSVPLLDTHAWFWWVDGSGRLTPQQIHWLDTLPETERPCLCTISLWEISMVMARGRVRLRGTFDDWIEGAASPPTVRLLAVTPAIAKQLYRLPASFHRDPADRIIVATACALNLPVLTLDDRIRKSGLVDLWSAD